MTWLELFLGVGLLAALTIIFYVGGMILYAIYKWTSSR